MGSAQPCGHRILLVQLCARAAYQGVPGLVALRLSHFAMCNCVVDLRGSGGVEGLWNPEMSRFAKKEGNLVGKRYYDFSGAMDLPAGLRAPGGDSPPWQAPGFGTSPVLSARFPG